MNPEVIPSINGVQLFKFIIFFLGPSMLKSISFGGALIFLYQSGIQFFAGTGISTKSSTSLLEGINSIFIIILYKIKVNDTPTFLICTVCAFMYNIRIKNYKSIFYTRYACFILKNCITVICINV